MAKKPSVATEPGIDSDASNEPGSVAEPISSNEEPAPVADLAVEETDSQTAPDQNTEIIVSSGDGPQPEPSPEPVLEPLTEPETPPPSEFEIMMAKVASGADLTDDEAAAYAEHEARQAAIANGTYQEG